MKKLLYSALLMIVSISYSQNLEWVYQIDCDDYLETKSMAIDVNGNTYLTGYFMGTSLFRTGDLGEIFNASFQKTNVFLSKYDKYGKFLWAHQFGENGRDFSFDVKLDSNGNSIIAGRFQGEVDFDPSSDKNIIQSTNNSENPFFCKLDSLGNLIWVKSISCPTESSVYSMAIDSDNYVYFVGLFSKSAIYMDKEIVSNGDKDIFILKVDMNGNLIWFNNIGGSEEDSPSVISIDNNGDLIYSGVIYGVVDIDPSEEEYFIGNDSVQSMFISKLNSSGKHIWTNYYSLGRKRGSSIKSVAIDRNNSIYFTGLFRDTLAFNTIDNPIKYISEGNNDIFISKLNSFGDLIWTNQYGGNKQDDGYSIAISKNKNELYLVGSFSDSVDFDPSINTNMLYSEGELDIFILKINLENELIWSKSIGGKDVDFVSHVLIDDYDNLFVNGYFTDTVDIDLSEKEHLLFSTPGYGDIFTAKLSQKELPDMEIENIGDIILYPNPADETVNIHLSETYANVKIEIFNLLGQLVVRKEFNNTNNLLFNFPCCERNYFVKLFLEYEYIRTFKIIR